MPRPWYCVNGPFFVYNQDQDNSGLTSTQFGCVTLLGTGSPQSFITRNAWEDVVRSGAATTVCETQTPPRSWGGFGESPPLQTSTAVRLSVQLLHNDQPTASLAVWTYIVPSETMRDSFLEAWHKLPKHLREIAFDFHGPGSDPDVITQLGDTLIEFADVFHVTHRLWLVLPPAVRSFGPTR